MAQDAPHRSTPANPEGRPRPRAGTLGAAVALAAANGLWSLFQWTELLIVRRGGDAFCVFGEGEACASAWNSGLPSVVQAWTGLPVAGWGLAWSLVALALPLGVLVRRAGYRALEPLWSATLLTALAGVAGVMGLAGWMLALGQLCTTCLLTYVLVLGYAGICLREARRLGGMEALRGAGVAAAATLIAFLLLLYPGLQTPQSVAHPGRALLERAGPLAGSTNEEMVEWLERLSPRIRQLLSDALASYNRSASLPQRAPRALIGPLEAPVRITEFSDILCGHCAALHETLEWLVEISPQGTLALEPRQFPLDGACNPRLEASAANSVRCIGARALICLEGRPGSFAFAGGLLANQQALTVDKIYEMAAPLLSREELEACITSAATQAKLEDDIAWALEHGIRGTPLVLVNGRQAPAFGPFLYAMVLARGDPGHRAFAELPPPASGIVR